MPIGASCSYLWDQLVVCSFFGMIYYRQRKLNWNSCLCTIHRNLRGNNLQRLSSDVFYNTTNLRKL